jgi:hypothetical protein
MQCFNVLKLVVHIMTAGLQRFKALLCGQAAGYPEDFRNFPQSLQQHSGIANFADSNYQLAHESVGVWLWLNRSREMISD